MADHIAVMNGGCIEQFGTPRDLYRRSAIAFIADFVGEANWLSYERVDAGHVRVGRQVLDTRGRARPPVRRRAPWVPGRCAFS